MTVSRFSPIQVLGNTYSVPARLSGSTLTVRVRAETVEAYVGTTLTCALPRLQGTQQHAIQYQQVIWSLVRTPGAFAAYRYRYRDDLFPSLTFRRAYDPLRHRCPGRADREDVRLWYLAASTAQSAVETALALLLDADLAPTFDAVRDVVRLPPTTPLPPLRTPVRDLATYDPLLPSRCAHG